MESFLETIAEDYEELIEKKDALNKFIYTQDFMDLDIKTKTLIRSQLKVMNQYANILRWRLDLLGIKTECTEPDVKTNDVDCADKTIASVEEDTTI